MMTTVMTWNLFLLFGKSSPWLTKWIINAEGMDQFFFMSSFWIQFKGDFYEVFKNGIKWQNIGTNYWGNVLILGACGLCDRNFINQMSWDFVRWSFSRVPTDHQSDFVGILKHGNSIRISLGSLSWWSTQFICEYLIFILSNHAVDGKRMWLIFGTSWNMWGLGIRTTDWNYLTSLGKRYFHFFKFFVL